MSDAGGPGSPPTAPPGASLATSPDRGSGARVPGPCCPRLRRVALRVLLATVLCGLFWSLGLPLAVDIPSLAGLALIAALAAPRKAAGLALALGLSQLAAEAGVRLLDLHRPVSLTYREHEKYEVDSGYTSGRGRYLENVSDVIDMPHGDSFALDPFAPQLIREPRRVVFRTDDRGHRNDRPYHGQGIVLAGDSFVVGNTTSQEETIPGWLAREHGLDVYSLGHPGDPNLYFAMIAAFLAEVDPSAKVLLFLFEGNDFKTDVPVRPLAIPPVYDQWKLRFSRAVEGVWNAPGILLGASRRIERSLLARAGEIVEVARVGESSAGFYGPYVDMACAPDLRFEWRDPPPGVIEHLGAVFFIPTNYRVYFDLLEPEARRGRNVPQPAPGRMALERWFGSRGVPVIDLEEPLRQRARELLPGGRYVWWRDDTHWNGPGQQVAARVVGRVLKDS